MARTSWKTYRRYLGLPGDPVEFIDRYLLSDSAPGAAPDPPEALDFASYGDRITDLEHRSEPMPAGSTPFAAPYVRRGSGLIFNLASYGHTLLSDFRAAGGRIVEREFRNPAELGALEETVVINCPGYGARALMSTPRSLRCADRSAG